MTTELITYIKRNKTFLAIMSFSVLMIMLFASMLFSYAYSYHWGRCRVKYEVIYPDTIIRYDTVFRYRWYNEPWNDDTDYHMPYTSSVDGTNFICIGEHKFARTTVPIRIISFKTIITDE